jgi:hypothetical protein
LLNFPSKTTISFIKKKTICFPPITYCFRVKILRSNWSSNFQSSFRIIYWFIFWQFTPKQILIKVLTAMIIMPPYRNIPLYGIESFICSLCLNNEIIIEIKLILLLKKVKKTNAITISIWICSQFLNNWKQYICDCVKISRFFCWLCPSYILNEIVKLLLNNTFIYLRFFYHGSVSKTFSYTLK